MTLVPATPAVRLIVKAAQEDPDGAEMLAKFALYETLGEFIDADRKLLDSTMEQFVAKRSADARRGLVRGFVQKRLAEEPVDDLLTAAEHITVFEYGIAKASGRDFDERKHRRDPYSGRFIIALPRGGVGDAVERIAELKRQQLLREGSTVHVRGEHLDEGGQSSGQGKKTIAVRVQPDADSMRDELQSHEQHVHPEELHIDPKELGIDMGGNRGRAFDALSYATSPRNAARATRSAPLGQKQFHDELSNFTNGKDGQRAAFTRINSAGRALSAVTQTGSGGNAVGGVAQLVGELGPQAEEVLGRNIRRTAYRYRGTERRPDGALSRDVAQISGVADTVRTNPAALTAAAGRPSGGGAPGAGRSGAQQLAPPARIAQYWADRGRAQSHDVDIDTDALDLRLRGDVAAAYFMRKLPKENEINLSQAAGRIPPSQGAIIDHAGNVVSEAQGFASDHYLPFDLKNLKRLNGGQYVRTRAYGGPSVEDVYTGLLSGARQLQVVSNSGVYTVEFDPDVRGGRRYSDKARNMIRRYQSLLSTVAQPPDNLAYTQDIDPRRRGELNRLALTRAGGDADAAKPIFDRLIQRERSLREAGIIPPEKLVGDGDLANADTVPTDEEAMADAREAALNQMRTERKAPGLQVRSMSRRDTVELAERADDLFHQGLREREEQRIRRLQLNGEGYHRALLALKQEFPYYIRSVDWEPLRDFGGGGETGRQQREPGEPPFAGDRNRRDPGYQATHRSNLTQVHETEYDSQGRPKRREKAEEAPQRRASDTGTGGGTGTGTGTGTTERAGRGASLGINVPFHPPHEDAPKLTDLHTQQDYYLDQAGTALTKVWPAVTTQTLVAGDPSKEQIANPRLVKGGDPMLLLKTLGNYTGPSNKFTVGASQLPQKLLELNDPELTEQAVGAVKQLNQELDDMAQDVDPQLSRLRDRIPRDAVDAAEQSMRLVAALQKPFADPASDPALYSPAGAATPQRFAFLNEIPLDPRNVDTYANLADGAGMGELKKVYEDFKQQSPEDRRAQIKRRVNGYQALTSWRDRNVVPPAAREAGYTWDDALTVRGNPSDNMLKKRLVQAQAGWSLAHLNDLATQLRGAGGGSPFAPPPSQPRTEEVAHRAPPLQPPRRDSPVLKFAKALLDQYVQL